MHQKPLHFNKSRSIFQTYSHTSPSNVELENMDLLQQRHNWSLGEQFGARNIREDEPKSFAELDFLEETSLLLAYDDPSESTGALFSSEFHINVFSHNTVFEILEVQLLCITTINKRMSGNSHICRDCSGSTKELRKWEFTKSPAALSLGNHTFPFSHLFSGTLPASTSCYHAIIDYQLKATAKVMDRESITYDRIIHLHRALRSRQQTRFNQTFPPLNISSVLHLSPLCYINEKSTISLQLSGIRTSGTVYEFRWRLQQISWRIEEHQRLGSHSCQKQRGHVANQQDHDEIIAHGEVSHRQRPWKTDMKAGRIEAEFEVSIEPESKCIPSVRIDDHKLNVWHCLVVEMLVVEEYVLKKDPSQAGLTSSTRLLCSKIAITVARHGNSGVAWDEETPPLYEDASESPPEYFESQLAS